MSDNLSLVWDKKRSSLYNTWYHMKSRCYETTHHAYPRYGGRGIRVCDRWIDPTKIPRKGKGRYPEQGFLNFVEDMEPTWFANATIDRNRQ